MEKTNESLEFEENITCPHCHELYTKDSWEYRGDKGNPENLGEFICDHCGTTFSAYREIEVTYSTYTVSKPK